ncbi:DUF881 domain-containing protein [Planococcus salinus]|uniref:DUF881 domain-containing protein n=1 Tax=Planococcus salinus TaxID=1848460 RepID=A0A3M8PAE0_9BACL|nr:DUF881 domain-containing protein [Planococcus salinus]RNF40676.1 DUF881 domain-containing protein [Planococcus salinus]
MSLRPNKSGKISKSIIFSLVFLVLGYILAYSYNLSKSQSELESFTGSTLFEEEERLRQELIEQQERNKSLREELMEKQASVQQFEQSFSEGENHSAELAEKTEALRRYLGAVPVEGEGLEVTLRDGEYKPDSENPNDYIVHESHVFQVINELYISGAQAISINGQRIHKNSHIVCTGPVITVDGVQYSAPFIIVAIGRPDVLKSSMELTGGVLDQLVNDNIIVTMNEEQAVSMPALLSES